MGVMGVPGVPVVAEVSDVEREHALALLRRHCVDGSLTLEDFADRAGVVLSARGSAELSAVCDDLPALPSSAVPVGPRVGARWIGGVFGTTRQRAQWLLPPRTNVVALFGAARVDLSDVIVDADEVEFCVVAVFGTVKLVVPRGIEVDVRGVPVFGTHKGGGSGARSRVVPGSPVVRVRCYPVFGTVKILER